MAPQSNFAYLVRYQIEPGRIRSEEYIEEGGIEEMDGEGEVLLLLLRYDLWMGGPHLNSIEVISSEGKELYSVDI